MNKHALEGCPRCGQLFTCKLNASLKCDCNQIVLTPSEMQYIRDISIMDYDSGCLCLNCLQDLQQEARALE
ncbi:hypothetical protein BWI96_18560 [Siphonobacter sp. SORGH_AS_0500]|uniref:cysteine-rich CWC family protein n=1 Tax=Siphonobacter sp. SORGH_AS_0500 TaxID=1864824 RepID=UPI000CC1CEE7|nr:cysteine-rich CWC family protein [Siphonobacter sp. SORGH_AS_0500]PKK35059.1 hypothetical protein BWI96_18560 [Siphonobacter sp. SORGH_AS_0500]